VCGICGWYRRGGPVDESVVRAQCATIVHRGPDDEGLLVDGDFGFGVRRLSIIDLAGGHQPMTSSDGRYSVVQNGEIVNYRELRRVLEEAGARFRTASDTEVIVEGFARWGDDVWARLDGMFGIALWDHGERTLRLVRDPLGIKPLFYALSGNALAFGSELKALRPVPGVPFEPRAASVDAFFAFGHVLAPYTIYDGIVKVPPGALLRVERSGEPRLVRYWRYPLGAPAETRPDAEWIDEFRSRFLATVERHLVADVPVGAFLSGGVDSSAVVAAIRQVTDVPPRTFTIGFDDPRVDESAYAASVARHLGCRHTSRVVQLEDAERILPALARAYDEPFADSSAIPTWYLSRLAREDVTVALSGDGGDELFAGYERHLAERLLHRYGRAPAHVVGAIVRGLPPLPSARWNALRQRVAKVRDDSMLTTTFQRFFSKYQLTPQVLRTSLYDPAFAARVGDENSLTRLEAAYFDGRTADDPVESLLFADTTVRLPDDMLTKVDRASMAHSLEVRVPFLSHVFVDWAARVPVDLKLRGRTGKWIVRRAVEGWLPPGVLERPKQGFAVPLARWIRGDLGTYTESVWRDARADDAGVFVADRIARLVAEHRDGRADHSEMLFALTMFGLWWAGSGSAQA
jgi:asparagine synthase (glutamine-hydrolysing)